MLCTRRFKGQLDLIIIIVMISRVKERYLSVTFYGHLCLTVSFRIDNSLTRHATEPCKSQQLQAEADVGRKCIIVVCKVEELLICVVITSVGEKAKHYHPINVM
jgi:hypothetical protein